MARDVQASMDGGISRKSLCLLMLKVNTLYCTPIGVQQSISAFRAALKFLPPALLMLSGVGGVDDEDVVTN